MATVTGEFAPAAITIAPTRMIPWIAFVPDIKGVCRIVGTFEMTSMPTKIASTKKVSSLRSSLFTGSCASACRGDQLPGPLVDDLAAVRDAATFGDLVIKI